MTAILKVDTIQDTSGNNIINESSDTITIGASGDTISIPSGATIANSGTATGFGKLLQVVTATDSSARFTNSTSFVTGSNTLAVNITPSATSSKVFVIVNTTAYNNVSGKSMYLSIYRDSSDLGNGSSGMINSYDTDTSGQRTIGQPTSMSVLDSPSSTSQLTYQVYVKTDSGGEIYFNYANIKASITAFEIAG